MRKETKTENCNILSVRVPLLSSFDLATRVTSNAVCETRNLKRLVFFGFARRSEQTVREDKMTRRYPNENIIRIVPHKRNFSLRSPPSNVRYVVTANHSSAALIFIV